MPSLGNNLQQNDKLLILLILAFEDKKNYSQLFKHLPKDKEVILKEEIDKLLNIKKRDRYLFLLKEIKSLQVKTQFSKIEYIHFSRLSEVLCQEQPQIIAIICGCLPKEKTAQILSTFDVNLRNRINTQPLQISPVLVNLIRKRFEDKFLTMEPLKDILYYKILLSLKEKEFFKLIRKMGLQELAIAFRGVDKLSLSKLCHGITKSNEKQLLQKMNQLKEIDYDKIKSAQKNIRLFTAIFNFNLVNDIFWEIGLLKLAHLLKGEEGMIIQQIYQKLPKIEANKVSQYLNKIESILPVEQKDKIITSI